MKRWAKNLFCLFSLLVFVGSVGIWVRSYSVWDQFENVTVQTDVTHQPDFTHELCYGIEWSCGAVRFLRVRGEYEGRFAPQLGWTNGHGWPTPTLISARSPSDRLNLTFGRCQLYWLVFKVKGGWGSYQYLVLPLWLFLPAAIPPLLWLRHWRKGRGRGFPVTPTSASKKDNVTTETQRHGVKNTEQNTNRISL